MSMTEYSTSVALQAFKGIYVEDPTINAVTVHQTAKVAMCVGRYATENGTSASICPQIS